MFLPSCSLGVDKSPLDFQTKVQWIFTQKSNGLSAENPLDFFQPQPHGSRKATERVRQRHLKFGEKENIYYFCKHIKNKNL